MKNEEFGLEGLSAAALTTDSLATAAAMSEQSFDVAIEGFNHSSTPSSVIYHGHVNYQGMFIIMALIYLGLCSEELLDEHGCVVRVFLGLESSALKQLASAVQLRPWLSHLLNLASGHCAFWFRWLSIQSQAQFTRSL